MQKEKLKIHFWLIALFPVRAASLGQSIESVLEYSFIDKNMEKINK